VDYVAVVVNYTDASSTNCTLELNASDVIYSYNWSNESSTYLSDNEYATANKIASLRLGITDTDAIYGNITSVVIKVEQHVVDAVPTKKDTTLKKTNLDTYNGSIAFKWVPMNLGEYKLSVFLDSDNNTEETNETNNNLTKRVIVAKRIDLELTSPTGGEVWEGVKNITWNASYEVPLLIDFYYSPDRGYRWINITTNETNDGSYAWNTEDVIDGEYMIKIVARAGMVTAEDRSDVFFVRNTEAGTEWGSFHANAGYAPCDGPDTNKIAWESDDIGAEGSSSLIVADGKIFVYCTGWGEMDSDYTYLVALRQWDDAYGNAGDVLWDTKIAPRTWGSWATPAYNDGSVFVTSGGSQTGGGYVYRIDADTGKKIWTFRFPGGYGSVNGGPAVTSRAVYVGDWDGRNYYCIDKNNGTELWRFPVSGSAQSVPAIGYGNAYFGSFPWGDGKAYAVNAWDGQEVWERDVTYDVVGSVTISDKVVYFTTAFVGADGGLFYALDAFNGSVIWNKPISYTDSAPAYYAPSKSPRSYVYVTGEWSGPGKTHCLDAKTGELIWEVSGLGFWTNSPVVTRDGKLFVGKYKGGGGMIPGYYGLYCLDAFTGEELWHSDCGGSSPVVVNGFVYTIGSGRVFVFGNGTRPDLTVEADAPDSKYVVGKKGNITATIENIGKSNVTKSFEVELRYSGKFEECIDTKTVEASPESPFKVNDTKPILFKWAPEKPGENRLTVEVDPDNNVSESGLPDNNIANVTVLVKDNKPDLVTIIETVSPNPAHVGDTVTVEANITNIGYETNESFWVRFSVDDVEENMKWTSLEDNVRLLDFTWIAINNGTHNLAVEANPGDKLPIMKEVTWTNNKDSREVTVIQPTPTPTPTSSPGVGPGSRGGRGGGDEGGIGEGSGVGEAGAGEAGGMQVPVNASGSADEIKKEVSGFPFGNASSGASGGGGVLPILLILLALLAIVLFYFGYYKEKRVYRGKRNIK
jgi:outer membrane protein assembly factor BamB